MVNAHIIKKPLPKGVVLNMAFDVMSVALPTAAGDHFKKMLNLNKTEKVVFIFCFDTKWCRLASGKNGLFTDISKNL